nr:hypothetical protein [Tanacetum cinerariifolium]
SSSQKATLSFTSASNLMSPPTVVSSVQTSLLKASMEIE